ncbi:glycosyl hydrolase family 18 protein [Vibrio coralliilyticus]|uniref:glycosyl hydrolase family 18 protein n=1 Tax=Vibrio coralliilyticus TaxID=190893 RepID=UPI002FD2B724
MKEPNKSQLSLLVGLAIFSLSSYSIADELLNFDPQTVKTYLNEGFEPDGSGSKLSYTSSRTINPLYNTYAHPELSENQRLSFTAYIDNQSIKDPRDTTATFSVSPDYGYGYDFAKIKDLYTESRSNHFSEVVYQGLAVCGDEHLEIKSNYYSVNAKNVSSDFAKLCFTAALGNGSLAPFDYRTDMVISKNTGQEDVANHIDQSNWYERYQQGLTAGLLNGFAALKEMNPNQSLGFAVGGPGRSSYFDDVLNSQEYTDNFINSAVDTFKRFPMFSSVHLLWPSYLTCLEDESCDQETQRQQYKQFLLELSSKLSAELESPKNITVLIDDVRFFSEENIDSINELVAANVKFRIDVNQEFSMQEGNSLGHDISFDEIEDLLAKLKDLGLPSHSVSIDMGNNSTAVAGSNIDEWSFNKDADKLGTFAEGLVDNFDVYNNYLNISNDSYPKGKNDFISYTDTVKGSSFVNNSKTEHYISHLSPIVAKKIGHILTQQGYPSISFSGGGMDNPLIYNALKEGSGEQAVNIAFDMANQYGCEQVLIEHEKDFRQVDAASSNSICQGVFNNDFSGYTLIDSVSGGAFGAAKIGDYLRLEIKRGDDILATSQHLVTSDSHIAGSHRKAVYSSNAMNAVLKNLDNFSRFKVGERNGSAAINTISSSYRNRLFCSYDCDGIEIVESVVSSEYSQIGQLSGYDVEPGSLITLTVYDKDGGEYAKTEYTPSEYMSVGFRWPDELCNILENDTEHVLECGELKGLDEFEVINSSVYRNFIWSKDTNAGKRIEITVASPYDE